MICSCIEPFKNCKICEEEKIETNTYSLCVDYGDSDIPIGINVYVVNNNPPPNHLPPWFLRHIDIRGARIEEARIMIEALKSYGKFKEIKEVSISWDLF